MDPQMLKTFMAEGKMPNFPPWSRRIVPSSHHQHSAAESGGVVEPPTGMK